MEEKKMEYAWIPKDLADKIKEIDKPESVLSAKIIEEYIEQAKRDMKINVESLDEDVVRFKGLMIKARQAFEEAKTEELNKTYELWEDFENKLPKLEKKVNKAIEKLNPLVKKCQELAEAIEKVHTWKIDELRKVIDALSSLYGENQKMVEFLVNNYKNKED